jgi:hypothetical protein
VESFEKRFCFLPRRWGGWCLRNQLRS